MNVLLVYDRTQPEQTHLAERLARSCPDLLISHSPPALGAAQNHDRSGADANRDPINASLCDVVLHLDSGPRGGFTPPEPEPAGSTKGAVVAWLGGFQQGILNPVDSASGFGEVWRHQPATGLALVSRWPSGQARTLLHAEIPTQRNWRHNQRQLIDACADYGAHWLRDAARRGTPRMMGRPADWTGLAPARPPSWRRLPLWFRHQSERVALRMHHRRHRDAQWRIGWADPMESPLAQQRQIGPHGRQWYADPFVWEDEQRKRWLFCEAFDDDKDRLGRIALFELEAAGGIRDHGIVLEESFHLSFPRVVLIGGSLFATVESGANQDVRLYEACPFPHRWRFKRILLKGEALIDPMLFQHDDGRWYLLVSTSSTAALRREVAPELRLFHSADPLTHPFEEHPQSPLLISSRGGRNAGLLRRDGYWLRAAQLSGYGGRYGETVRLFRIMELSTHHYREVPVSGDAAGLQPSRLRDQLRASHLHTLNQSGSLLVYDFIHG